MHIVSPTACPRSLSDLDREKAEEHRLLRIEEMRAEVERRDVGLFKTHPACARVAAAGCSPKD